jgi:hypothetical protein
MNPEQRRAQAEQQQRQQEARLRELELEQQALERQEQEELRLKEQARKALAREYPPLEIPGTELTTETAWRQVLEQLQQQMTAANYRTWLAETTLVSCDVSSAVIVGPSSFVVDWCLATIRKAGILTHGRISPGRRPLPHRDCYPDRCSGARADALVAAPSGGSRSAKATGSSQWGQSPPGPMRRQNCWHSSHRCCPR